MSALVQFTETNRNYERIFDFQVSSASVQGTGIYLSRLRQTNDLRLANWLDPANQYDVMIPNAIQNGQFHHYVAVYSPSGTISLYINGVLSTRLTNPRPLPNVGLASNYIARSNYTCNDYDFRGFMDNVRVYNRALSDQDILTLYRTDLLSQEPITVRLNNEKTSTCQQATLTASSTTENLTYQWLKNGQVIQGATSQTYVATESGRYEARGLETCLSQQGLSAPIELDLNVPEQPTFDPIGYVCEHSTSVQLRATGDNVRWYADPALSRLVAEGSVFEAPFTAYSKQTIVYYATQSAGPACTSPPATLSAVITTIPCSKSSVAWFIPSAFTPNGDGLNDDFEVFSSAPTPFRLTIFNRWGTAIYALEADNSQRAAGRFWDGTWQGQPLPNGYFTYKLDVLQQPHLTYTGSFVLIR